MGRKNEKSARNRANAKQARFVAEYLIDGNATQAAIRAGYSKATAYSIGSRLLRNVEVAKAIDEGREAALQAAGAEAIAVIRELGFIATSDIGEAFDELGNLKALKDMPVHLRRAISGVEVDEIWEGRGESRTQIGITRKVKLWDKNKALELIGKHKKLFTEKHELTGKDGKPIETSQVDDLSGYTDEELRTLRDIQQSRAERVAQPGAAQPRTGAPEPPGVREVAEPEVHGTAAPGSAGPDDPRDP